MRKPHSLTCKAVRLCQSQYRKRCFKNCSRISLQAQQLHYLALTRVHVVVTVLCLQRRVTRPASAPTRTPAQTHGSSGAPTGSCLLRVPRVSQPCHICPFSCCFDHSLRSQDITSSCHSLSPMHAHRTTHPVTCTASKPASQHLLCFDASIHIKNCMHA
jgi:hypothetical protein